MLAAKEDLDGSGRPAAVALLAVGALLLVGAGVTGCQDGFEADLPPRDQLHYPVGTTMHPNGRFLYVVNSNFNVIFRPALGGTVSVIDTRSLELSGESTPYIPSFGADIELNDDASKAYVAVREGDAVVALDVQGDNPNDELDGGALSCPDADGEASSDPERCIIDRVPDTEEGAPFSRDPFGLSVATLRPTNPASDEEVPIDLVSLSYLASNRVSTLSIPNRDIENASLQTASLIAGGNAVARRPGTLDYYVAGRNTNGFAVFSPFLNLRSEGSFGEVQALIDRGAVTLSHSVNEVDARGITFGPEGQTLYVTTRRPDALHIFDVVADNLDTGSGTRHRLRKTIPLDEDPSRVFVNEGPDGRRLVYVPSFGDRSIQVVDPRAETVVDVIDLNAQPFDMAFDTGDSRCENPGQLCRAYVTLFDDAPAGEVTCGPDTRQCGSVAVIDLDPASPRYHRVIAKIR